MSSRALAVLTCWLFACAAAFAQPPQRDAQFWLDINVQKHLPKHFSVIGWTSFRWFDNVSRPGEQDVGGAVSYTPVRYFTGTLWYRFQRQTPTPTTLTHEHRYFPELTGRLPLRHRFELADRSRYEFRFING